MTKRVNIRIRGAVQGVGFRPFVYRLAGELGVRGWVMNNVHGVVIDAEAEAGVLDDFLLRLEREKPPRAGIQSLEHTFLDPSGYSTFVIQESESNGSASAAILPDIAVCPDCLREMLDPPNRRFRYPFINCTNCGPRYSIIASLPYDRPGTSMSGFVMCDRCRREYEDPKDRRYHAQPIACPLCGPRLELWNPVGEAVSSGDEALLAAARSILDGKIVAVKGLGGFQLITAAGDESAVARLRERKHREEKPFALMAPSLDAVKSLCAVSPIEERLLLSPESPIVLLRRSVRSPNRMMAVAPSVAPANPYLGMMLPYTPLHHLLMREIGGGVVATSGNISDEPLCIDEREALRRLSGIADLFLVHNRPIVRHVDDSIVRVMMGRELLLRRARGYAPLPVPLKDPVVESVAVGAQLKNSVAVARGRDVFISQHIGDLETRESAETFRRTLNDLASLYHIRPVRVGADMHPDCHATRFAESLGAPVTPVQHHYAHILSCMADNQIGGQVLGVAWDGTGYGPDGTVWGGEFLLADGDSFRRAATFRTFLLPGGESAVREPRRALAGVLYEILGDKIVDEGFSPALGAFTPQERRILLSMLRNRINAPATSSAGRLFDAVASLVGLRHRISFEGQAAMELEFAAHASSGEERYPYELRRKTPFGPLDPGWIVDWEPIIRTMLRDEERLRHPGVVASRFHNTMVEIIVDIARHVNEPRVVLTGGCFQNLYLAERAIRRLEEEGFRPYWHQRVPPNDGGISLGQICAATAGHQRHHLLTPSAENNA